MYSKKTIFFLVQDRLIPIRKYHLNIQLFIYFKML